MLTGQVFDLLGFSGPDPGWMLLGGHEPVLENPSHFMTITICIPRVSTQTTLSLTLPSFYFQAPDQLVRSLAT